MLYKLLLCVIKVVKSICVVKMTDLVHVLAVQDSVGSGYFSLRPKKAGGGTYSCRPPRPSGSARRAEPSDDEVRRRARVVVVLHVS